MSLMKFVDNPYMEKIYLSFRRDLSDEAYGQALEEAIKRELGISHLEIIHMECGVGLSIRVRADGKGVFQVKIIKGDNSLAHQTECCNIQRYLRSHDYPCTCPVGSPISFLGDSLQIEEYNSRGDYKDSHDPAIMRLQAEGLAKLHCLLRSYDGRNLDSLISRSVPRDRLWDNPPQAVFDFKNIQGGDSAIREKALMAKAIFESRPDRAPIISHEDWSNKHFRFQDQKISVIYDWDSLVKIDELHSLGIACSTYTATWYFPTKIFPTKEQSRGFVECYAASIGKSFSQEEMGIISAYAAFTIAYTAMCTIAFNGGSLGGTDIEIPFGDIKNGRYF